MTPETMQQFKTELDRLAEQIRAKMNLIESKRQDEIALDEEIQTRKFALIAEIGTRRDAESGKLVFTNDDQRKAALHAALDADKDFQMLKSSRSVKTVERVLLESELDFLQKSYRNLELQMLFHANNPAA